MAYKEKKSGTNQKKYWKTRLTQTENMKT